MLANAGGSSVWWARQDSNLQPDRYERPALTIELQAPPRTAVAFEHDHSGKPAPALRQRALRVRIMLKTAGNGAGIVYRLAADPAMVRSIDRYPGKLHDLSPFLC